MGVLTFLVFDSDNSIFLFSGGSIGSTMKVFGPNFWVVFTLFLVSVSSTIFLRKKIKLLLLTFLFVFTTWFLCGRTIGVHWTGELITGWFYLSTGKIILCEKTEDCKGGDAIAVTKIYKSSLFQIRLVNRSVDKSIFVGPIISQEIKKYFEDYNSPPQQ